VLVVEIVGARRSINAFTTNYSPRFAGAEHEHRTLGAPEAAAEPSPDEGA